MTGTKHHTQLRRDCRAAPTEGPGCAAAASQGPDVGSQVSVMGGNSQDPLLPPRPRSLEMGLTLTFGGVGVVMGQTKAPRLQAGFLQA